MGTVVVKPLIQPRPPRFFFVSHMKERVAVPRATD